MIISPQNYTDFKAVCEATAIDAVFVFSDATPSYRLWAIGRRETGVVVHTEQSGVALPGSFSTDFPNAVTLTQGLLSITS
jgi:tryptophan synthase alpha subunit